MYQETTAAQIRKFLHVDDGYRVDGLLVHGCAQDYPFGLLTDRLAATSPDRTPDLLPVAPSLPGLRAFDTAGGTFWFAVCFGGAMTAQITHLASLLGSRANILIGTCGGLQPGRSSGDLVVPTYAYGDESTTRLYRRDDRHEHHANLELSSALAESLRATHAVHQGPTTTCQAILAETRRDVEQWSAAGYLGVEMEAATLFAVSARFTVPAAAALMIADNLVAGETFLHDGYASGRQRRRAILADAYNTVLPLLTAQAGADPDPARAPTVATA